MKKKEIFLFCPFILDGGLEKTIYSNYLSRKFNINLITNTQNFKKLDKLNNLINIINLNNRFLLNFRILNNLFCIIKLFSIRKSKLVIFSMQDHFFLCLLKFFKLNFKLIIRTQTAIINDKNTEEKKILKKNFFFRNFITFFYKYADLLITFSGQNKKYLKQKIKAKNVKVVYNFFPKFNGKKKN